MDINMYFYPEERDTFRLPENQHYQIWAELQDRMVKLGILDESDRKLKQIPYMEDALSLILSFNKDKNVIAYSRLKDSLKTVNQIQENKNALLKYNVEEEQKKMIDANIILDLKRELPIIE